MSLNLNTRFITLDEFKEYTGIDLEVEIKKDGNPSRTAEAFLERTIDRFETYLAVEYFKNMGPIYEHFNNFNKACYKKALIEQVLYVFRNGEIGVDSGVDLEEGCKVSRNYIKTLMIAPFAEQKLIQCGVLNRNVNAIRGGFYGYGY